MGAENRKQVLVGSRAQAWVGGSVSGEWSTR